MPTKLLNDDGTASMATLLMSSHHAFRRDLACFAKALASPTRDDRALADEWAHFRGALHGHHTVEDTAIFPGLRESQPELAGAIDELDAHHRAIDPLLERGDRAFAELAGQLVAARQVIDELASLVATHLDAEEKAITPSLRGAKEFPAPPDDAALAMYADGFAWSLGGIAPGVQQQILAMLPAALSARIPAAREAFDARCRRTWGEVHAGSSQTSVPGA